MRPMTCPKCGAGATPQDAFCPSCGTKVGATADELQAEGAQIRAEAAIVRARKWLLIVAVLTWVSAVVFYFLQQGQVEAGQMNLVLAINVALGFLYLGMWVWARRNPLAAATIALLTFVTVHFVDAILDPKSIIQGIFVKILFVAALIGAVRAAFEARRLKALATPH
jgi:hypothetical protein